MAESHTVRQRVAALIEALDGYTESRQAPDRHGLDPQSILHKSFSVAIASSSALPEQRQRPAEGVMVVSEVVVRVAYRLRGDAAVSDYDEALQGEDTVRIALAVPDRTGGLCRLTYQGAARQLTAAGDYLITTLRYQALHLVALSSE